ncbi:hypothetical protein E3N88_25482 [Mikania micrantha]|uniref:CCHC-type domain-containing protein n=1 Tax=Mikania micrantha TaxID=192012 RepID=A0A5N6N528_9ASTR|nr:hypothetical protein E3N88_25482 [Mikania micrantha]
MDALNKHDTENGTLNKPPMFTREDFDTWKVRMEGFIRNQDFKLWKSVPEGPYIPTIVAAGVGGAVVPKDPSMYSDEDYKKMEVDSKALWLIQMSIPNSIIHAFKKCKSAKELWNSLQQMYEGSDDVKENKKDMLKEKFENFCHENNENMSSQYLRYVQLVDELTTAGVTLDNQDVLRKFLRSLPKFWNIYPVTIRRTENLKTLTLGELFGILSAYQMEIDLQESKPSAAFPSGSAALYVPTQNSSFQGYQPVFHSTALPSQPNTTYPKTSTPSSSNTIPFTQSVSLVTSGPGALLAEETNYFHLCQEDLEGIPADDLEEIDINYQMAMISFSAKKFYQRTGRQFKKHNMKTGFGLDKSKIRCYNYRQLGHFARECKAPRNQQQQENGKTTSKQQIKPSMQMLLSIMIFQTGAFKQKMHQSQTMPSWQMMPVHHSRDKFLSQGEKFEKIWKMNSISNLAKGKTAGLGYNSVEPPVVYTPQVDVKCKPEIKLVFDEELGIHMVDSESEVSDNTSVEDTTKEEVVVPEIKTKTVSKRKNHKSKQINTTVFVKPKQSTEHNKGTISSEENTTDSQNSKQNNYVSNPSVHNRKKGNGPSKSNLKSGPKDKVSQAERQQLISCLMCGDSDHFAADCLYNPSRRSQPIRQSKPSYRHFRQSFSSSEDNQSVSEKRKSKSRKKPSEAAPASDEKRKEKHSKSSEALPRSSLHNQKTRPSPRRSSKACHKSTSDEKIKKPNPFMSTRKGNMTWTRKESEPPLTSSTSASSVLPNLHLKHFTYYDAEGKPKTTMAWVPKRH